MSAEDKLVAALNGGDRPTISFEFFPPKDSESRASLFQAFDSLSDFDPNFVSVTYGAMGSNQASSIEVVEHLAPRVPTIAHLTCIGATRDNITSLLRKYEEIGVAGVLALRGDKPKHHEGDVLGDFKTALDLVALAKESSKLLVGVAAFPEKHPESPNLQQDIDVLVKKQAAGALFAITQLFFDIDAYFDLVSKAKASGIWFPIIPGIMPIANAKQVLRMAEMSGAKVPSSLHQQLLEASDDQAARRIGMDFSIDLARKLIDAGAPGVHVFTLNHHRATTELLKGAGLA